MKPLRFTIDSTVAVQPTTPSDRLNQRGDSRHFACRVPATTKTAKARQRGGYVLLLVLIVLVIASVSLVTLASGSYSLVIDSTSRQDELQRRWGTLSCQHAILKSASTVFAARDEMLGTGATPESLQAPITDQIILGGQTISVVLADEEAKLSINTLFDREGSNEIQRAIQQLIGPGGAIAVSLMPSQPAGRLSQQEGSLSGSDDDRDDEDEGIEISIPPAFQSWGQVFDYRKLAADSGGNVSIVLPQITSRITCWGSGRLNMDRASDDAILLVCKTVVTDGLARRILTAYRDSAQPDLKNVLLREVGNEADRNRVSDVLGQMSATYSMWIFADGKQGKDQKFVVLSPDINGTLRTMEFEF